MLQIVELSVLLSLGLGLFSLSKPLAMWLAGWQDDNPKPFVALGLAATFVFASIMMLFQFTTDQASVVADLANSSASALQARSTENSGMSMSLGVAGLTFTLGGLVSLGCLLGFGWLRDWQTHPDKRKIGRTEQAVDSTADEKPKRMERIRLSDDGEFVVVDDESWQQGTKIP